MVLEEIKTIGTSVITEFGILRGDKWPNHEYFLYFSIRFLLSKKKINPNRLELVKLKEFSNNNQDGVPLLKQGETNKDIACVIFAK